jgi:hypothetical protein
LKGIIEKCNRLSPPYVNRPPKWLAMMDGTKASLAALNSAEISFGQKVGKDGDPAIYPALPPDPGFLQRLLWACQNPLEGCVSNVWKHLFLNCALTMLALLAGHMNHLVSAKLQTGKVTPITQKSPKLTKVA